jgi:hypothetical protein
LSSGDRYSSFNVLELKINREIRQTKDHYIISNSVRALLPHMNKKSLPLLHACC